MARPDKVRKALERLLANGKMIDSDTPPEELLGLLMGSEDADPYDVLGELLQVMSASSVAISNLEQELAEVRAQAAAAAPQEPPSTDGVRLGVGYTHDWDGRPVQPGSLAALRMTDVAPRGRRIPGM